MLALVLSTTTACFERLRGDNLRAYKYLVRASDGFNNLETTRIVSGSFGTIENFNFGPFSDEDALYYVLTSENALGQPVNEAFHS